MSRALLVALPLLVLGCSSAPPPPPPRPLVLAILPAPTLALQADSEDEDPGHLLGGDFLLEVATQLSAEARLDLCLVPGPLLVGEVAGGDEEALEEALLSVSEGLGQIAAPVFLGLSQEDAQRARLLEVLKESVRDHPGQANVWGRSVLGWRAVGLCAGGTLAETETEALAEAERARPKGEEAEDEEPEDEERAAEVATPLLVVLGDPATPTEDARVRLRVVAGAEPEVLPLVGALEVRVPPLAKGLYAVAVLHPDRLVLEWRSAEPERVSPPEPVSLPWPKRGPQGP